MSSIIKVTLGVLALGACNAREQFDLNQLNTTN